MEEYKLKYINTQS